MTEILGVDVAMNPWALLLLVVLATVVLAYLISMIILWVFRRFAQKTSTEIDDRIYRLLERYLFPLLIVGGFLLTVDVVTLPPKILQTVHGLLTVCGLSLVIFLSTKAALLLFRNMEARYEAIRNIKGPIEILIKIIFTAVGGMIILDSLGISLTPIVTTLGIGSLAVAIALQDTLGNFFAGLYLKADRPIRVGHYVRLEGGQEGHVIQIGWRSTRIRALQNNIIIVPNGKLAQTIITNFYLPEKRTALLISIGVTYDSDPDRVEEALVEEAKSAVGEVDGLLGEPEPFVRFIPGFGDYSLNFTLICHVREFVDQFLVQHELRKRIVKRFAREGNHITFAIRAAYPNTEPNGRFEESNPTREH